MEAPALVNDLKRWMWRRDLATEYSVGSTTLTLSAIIGIAIGGAVLLFAILATIGIIHVKKKHRREKQRMSEAAEDGHVSDDLKTATRSTRPLEVNTGRRLSFNPFLPVADDAHRQEWVKQDGLQMPPMVKSKSVNQKAFFRTSSVRESWPLATTKSLGFLPGQSNMILSPVAPPGYVVQDPKWPKRTASMLGRRNSQDSSKSASRSRDPYPMDVMPYQKIHRRSTSENQLSTILRSTSQRLKTAQSQSMTRTLSTLGRFPGLPPSERLPTPPMRKATESREVLIEPENPENPESVGSSIYDVYARTPSPTKKHSRASSHRSPTRQKSPTPSAESQDSLCGTDTPDLVIPAPLTSPSRSGPRGAKRHTMRISSGGAKEIAAMINKDSRGPLFATGSQELTANNKIVERPQRISLSGDPFYSSVRSAKPIIPSTQVQGPRPMYFRKATFGQEATPERPASFCSPLRDVSGNVQTPPKRDLPDPPINLEPNPFQWSPKEAMQTRATQTSPKRSGSRRKGHKRSNVIRMSNLSRPASTVDVVPEEPEEVLPLKFNVPGYSSFLSIESAKTTSPTKSSNSSRRTSVRPPSSATFNPSLVVAALKTRSEDNSPTRRPDSMSDVCYSPTLSVCNYYTEQEENSEDEFFKLKGPTSLQPSPSTIKERRHGRNYSADLTLFPTHQSQQYIQERLLSFPPLPLDIPTPILTPRPTSRPLPNITSTMNGLRSSAATPAPPLLTIPGHLTGPRSEPGKHTRATLSPPRESMLSTVNMLRRMNSEISTNSAHSLISTDNDSESSPTLRSHVLSTSSSAAEIEERGRSRGSKHYLALGQSSLAATRARDRRNHHAPEKRDSHRIHKERRKKRSEEASSNNLIDELTPVKEGSSPPTGTNALGISGLRFPTLSHEGSVKPSPERQRSERVSRSIEMGFNDEFGNGGRSDGVGDGEKGARWSDAMSKPVRNAVRRESKMEHPAPVIVTPPKWALSGLGLAGVGLDQEAGLRVSRGAVDEGGLEREGERGGKEAGRVGEVVREGKRPDSMGLYDQEGFLKSSPDRERILRLRAMEEMRGNARRDGKSK